MGQREGERVGNERETTLLLLECGEDERDVAQTEELDGEVDLRGVGGGWRGGRWR